MIISQTIFYAALGMIKISIILFNRRLTGLTSRRWMIAHNIFLFIVISYIVTSIFLTTFSVNPPPAGWQLKNEGKMATPPKHRLPTDKIALGLSIIHIALDFALLSVPLIILHTMRMDMWKKLRLGFLFSVGAASTIGAIMRPILLNSKQKDITCKAYLQFFLSIIDALIIDDFPNYIRWNIIDMFFAITVASLPTLNCLITKGRNGSADFMAFPAPATVKSGSPEHATVVSEREMTFYSVNTSSTNDEESSRQDRPG